jgi:hypothetical protein
MSKVFVSYRHVEPDQTLARRIVEALSAAGHAVFWDTDHKVGQRWAEVIERNLRDSRVFVVLVSQESMRSDMVREEVRLAHELSKQPQQPLAILPIRVAYLGTLPYDLAARLDPIQYTLWRSNSDTTRVLEEICEAVTGAHALPAQPAPAKTGTEALSVATENGAAPLPRAEPRLESGTIRLNSPFYVAREEDALVLEQVRATGTTVVLKGVRQIGKSSLLARARCAAYDAEVRTFYLDLQILEPAHLKDLGSLFRYFARRLAFELQSEIKPETIWNDDDGPKFSLSCFIEQALLAPSRKPVVLLFDEVDRIFEHPAYRDEFFATIRYWHNQRANRPEPWDRLNLVIAHSTEPSLWIQDIHQSPFNVGERVRLRDFNPAEVADLNQRYGGPLRDGDLPLLLALVGGHPYLIRQALYCLARNKWAFTELQRHARESDGPFGDHLKRFVWGLSQDRALKDAFKSILRHGQCDDEQHFQRLTAVGLIVGADRSEARPRCELYAEYFKKHL